MKTRRQINRPRSNTWSALRLTYAATFVFLLLFWPSLATNSKAQDGKESNASVSTGGVARIVDKDFEQPFSQLPDTEKVNSGIRIQPAFPLTSQKSQLGKKPSSQMSVLQKDLDQKPTSSSSAEAKSSRPLESSSSVSGADAKPQDSTGERDIEFEHSGKSEGTEQSSVTEQSDGTGQATPDETTETPTTKQQTKEHESQASIEADSAPGKDSSHWSFQKLTDRKSLPSTIQMFVSVAAISLVPAILLMTTCFIRIVVVLGILRQAIGLQQLPPTQVTTALALMMTFLIMAPTWKQVKEKAVDPYTAEGSTMTWEEAWDAGIRPVKQFMWSQIRRAENEKDFWVFYDYLPEEERTKEPESIDEIPLRVMLPAFMISELKVAFLIGIQILLPFLILDIVVASLCNTMGLIMLPPAVVSLPLKLLLFVMVDGWNLVVAMLLNSFSML